MLGPGRSIGDGENWPNLRYILGVELKRLPSGLDMGVGVDRKERNQRQVLNYEPNKLGGEQCCIMRWNCLGEITYSHLSPPLDWKFPWGRAPNSCSLLYAQCPAWCVVCRTIKAATSNRVLVHAQCCAPYFIVIVSFNPHRTVRRYWVGFFVCLFWK